MSIDLAKLTLAPWEQDDTWLVSGRGEWSDGTARTLSETKGFAKFDNKADAEYCAKAHAAIHIMIRRGWGVGFSSQKGPMQGWYLNLPPSYYPMSSDMYPLANMRADDPFTVLIMADEWMKKRGE